MVQIEGTDRTEGRKANSDSRTGSVLSTGGGTYIAAVLTFLETHIFMVGYRDSFMGGKAAGARRWPHTPSAGKLHVSSGAAQGVFFFLKMKRVKQAFEFTAKSASVCVINTQSLVFLQSESW
jgi:hypothetical protein